MSVIKSLQNSTKTFTATNANVSINLGYGNANIDVTARNVAVTTKCGDHNINVNTTENAYVKTGCCGEDNVNATVGGNATIITGGSDDVVQLEVGGNFYVDAGVKNTCSGESDNDTVLIKSNLANGYGKNFVGLGDGEDTAVVVGNNTDICKEDGSLLLGVVGNNINIESNASENVVGAYGNNYYCKFADNSVNDVRSLDYWLEDGSDDKLITVDDGSRMSLKDIIEVTDTDGTVKTLNQYDNSTPERQANLAFFKNNLGDIYNQITYTGTEITNPITLSDDIVDMNKDEIAEKYNLSASEREILDSVDLTEEMGDGNSVYTIAYSPRRQQYVVCKRDGNCSSTHSRAVADGECIAFNVSAVEGYYENHIKTEKVTTTDTYVTSGVANWAIDTGNNSTLNATISTYDGYVDITGDDITYTDNITVTGGHVSTRVTENIYDTEYQKESFILSGFKGSTWNSPLILDMNGDGKVSAASGYGIDVNNDGKADGAATDGDKMLAMSDMNDNGTIDGTEVFGNNTVSPFTGKALNAANGFEALKMLAEEAEALGYECIENGEVDIQALAKILEKYGIKLGFVSDTNNTEVEDLSGVKTINVENYSEVDESGNVQHRQQGSFEAENGETRKVDDVWFKS